MGEGLVMAAPPELPGRGEAGLCKKEANPPIIVVELLEESGL